MRTFAKGFTLIELVIVIAILGILAAIAIPKYIDLSAQARTATMNGIVGAVDAGSAVNYAGRKAGATGTIATNGAACGTVVPALLSGGAMPTGYTVTAKTLSTTEDATDTCTINGPSATTGTATILIIS